MTLEKLQSGLLLFDTREGLVSVRPAFRQRLALLWTFRNFRQLSVPLLNPRERMLVELLFRRHTGIVAEYPDPDQVIGKVENFVPAAEIAAEVINPLASQRNPALTMRPAAKAAKRAPKTPRSKPAPSVSTAFGWSKLGTTLSALSLCVVGVIAWHRIQAMPASEANASATLQRESPVVVNPAPEPPAPTVAASRPGEVQATSNTAPPAVADGITASGESAALTPPPTAAPAQPPDKVVDQTPVKTHETFAATRERAPSADGKPARLQQAVSSPTSPRQASVPATRPPLRFVYPVCSSACTRGEVSLTAGVDANGIVRSVRVNSGNRVLAAAAIRAVRQWRYRPYLKDGQRVDTETNILISFISNEAISMSFPPETPASHKDQTGN
jgi:protein TonB